MHQLHCTSPGLFEYSETDIPVPSDGEALVRVRRVGVCGTDIHAFGGNQPYFSYPRILGHELSVAFVEGSGGFKPGEKLSVIPYLSCGHCIACRNNKPNCCSNIKVLGVHADGGMREFFTLPSSALIRAEGLDDDQLALIEPLAIGAHGISRANIQPGESVLVMGAGPIGLGTMALAKLAGAHVIAADPNAHRLQQCRDLLHIPYTLDPTDAAFGDSLREITSGDMPSVVIDATGNLDAINNGFRYLAHTGRYVLIGLQKGIIQVDHPEFHKREATLMSSRNATRKDFEDVIAHIREGRLHPALFISGRLAFHEVAEKFRETTSDPRAIKIMIDIAITDSE